ncbi:hypothetical protein [Natrinema salaciae]|uniref:Uncharacterized protein n=1 Tax=Natrinema salaciae TaxID=1186196 RepID=A0A1H9GMH4_9EURY|nr:hypothetical protein [Natrinema salaciae]SEQ51307.1 hypothetical protein SAMN04489841_1934 [Natrinema salaciae]
MNVLDSESYSYVLVDDDGEWILTFLLGGPVERDVSVALTDDEVTAIAEGDRSTGDIVEQFRDDPAAYEGRRVHPPVRPRRDSEAPDSDS